jgi:rubrerythrin
MLGRIGKITIAALAAGAVTVGVTSIAGRADAARTDARQATLSNLQAAYDGESNAQNRYLAYARRAEAEGYTPVASLFRAAARAEQVHAANHAVVIRELGGSPTATITTPDVLSTKENLAAAIKGESYERDTMYPEFLKQARAAGNRAAIKTFNEARTAETEHAKLYTAALGNMDQLQGSTGRTYYVCTVCGYTTEKLDFAKCPSCFSTKDKYIAIA